jgi:hypothetical protein
LHGAPSKKGPHVENRVANRKDEQASAATALVDWGFRIDYDSNMVVRRVVWEVTIAHDMFVSLVLFGQANNT